MEDDCRWKLEQPGEKWGLLLRPGKQGGEEWEEREFWSLCWTYWESEARERSPSDPSGDGEQSKTRVNIEKGRWNLKPWEGMRAPNK